MGGSSSIPQNALTRSIPSAGITRICVAGFTLSHHTGRARDLADAIIQAFPDRFESWFYFDSHSNFRLFLNDHLIQQEFQPFLTENAESPLSHHHTSPIVWLEACTVDHTAKLVTPLGGRDRFCEWVLAQEDLAANPKIHDIASHDPGFFDVWVNEDPGTAQLHHQQHVISSVTDSPSLASVVQPSAPSTSPDDSTPVDSSSSQTVPVDASVPASSQEPSAEVPASSESTSAPTPSEDSPAPTPAEDSPAPTPAEDSSAPTPAEDSSAAETLAADEPVAPTSTEDGSVESAPIEDSSATPSTP